MSTPASSTPAASTVVKSLPSGTIDPRWLPTTVPSITSALLAATLSFLVADITNPVELTLLGPVPLDLKLAYQATAGADSATWYRADYSTDAPNPPFTLPTQNPGVVWVAIGGRYSSLPLAYPAPGVGLMQSGVTRIRSTFQL